MLKIKNKFSAFKILFLIISASLLLGGCAAGTTELNISYKKEDGSWSDRIKTPYQCGEFLSLSPDGKYLFCLQEGISWINTSFIDDLKPQNLK